MFSPGIRAGLAPERADDPAREKLIGRRYDGADAGAFGQFRSPGPVPTVVSSYRPDRTGVAVAGTGIELAATAVSVI